MGSDQTLRSPAKRVQAARWMANLGPEVVADALGVSVDDVRLIEAGRLPVDAAALEELAESLEAHAAQLVGVPPRL